MPTPGEFMQTAATPINGNTPWAGQYSMVLRRVVLTHAAQMPRTLQKALGPSELGTPCLSGDTEIVTRAGLKRIADVAMDGEAELLVPLLYSGSNVRKRWGKFQRMPVTNFGSQLLFEVTLRRNQEVKIVHATTDHQWFRSYWSGKTKKQERLKTSDLRKGHRLTQLRRAMPSSATLMPVAVAQGFVFGDGTKGSNNDSKHRPARLSLYHNGKDEALLKYFPGEHRQYKDPDHAHVQTNIQSLPRFWKKLPPIDESASFLMSWLAGYFAADGCVSEDGHCSISSANSTHLTFVRDVAAVCGIGYGQIQCNMRYGISGKKTQSEKTPLYRLSLRRWDLPTWFFLIEKHLQRVKATSSVMERDPHWIVESVEPTGRMEPVYCATVDGIGAFGLADDLMTGNCDRQVAAKLAGLERTNHVVDPWASIMGTAGHAWMADAFSAENTRLGTARWLAEFRVWPHPEHPGTGDLYDAVEDACVDHKFLGDTPRDKLKKDGPPRRYLVQLLLYGRGFRNIGLPVRRVVLVAWPRTKSSMDYTYVYEHECTPADDELLEQVFQETAARKIFAQGIIDGQLTMHDIPATPSDDECIFCPYYRAEAARNPNVHGCAGAHLLPGRSNPSGSR